MSNRINGATTASCGNCAHSIIEGEAMFCTLNPPMTSPIVVVGMTPDGLPMPSVLGWVSNNPSVNPDRKCGQHKRQLVTIEGDAPDRRFSSRE